ncbi:MAG: hypothetical protein ABI488_03990 [Polyangiaceae bacterium]
MSIAGDLLTSASPTRLLCRRGTWLLEVVRLVPVERNVFQPRVQRLEGMETVIQYLKRNGDNGPLAAAASQLMRASRADDDRFYDAVDGEWVPGEPGTRPGSVRPSAPPPADTSEVVELRAELLVLRASHERLRERVQRLESQVSRSGTHDVLSVSPTPAVVMSRTPEAPRAPEAFASTLMQGHAPIPSDSPPVGRSGAPAVQSPARAGSAMNLPPGPAINACLQGLIGDSSEVREKRPVNFAPSELGPCWMSRLIDEAGVEVGVIVADQPATATLGGALMALPEHEIAAQRSHETPSQDVVGAMSEVANQLCETINAQAGGVQVRVKPIEEFASGSLDWTSSASNALELELAGGAGRLFLFAR